LSPTNEGLLLVDQRTAHVRVLYEQALDRLKGEQGNSQQLLFPETVDLKPAEAEALDALLPDLRALGFDLERMSGRTVALRGVPTAVPEGKEPAVLRDLLQATVSRGDVEDERRSALAKQFAQQNAVRRGQPLTDAERRGLLNDLFRCEMPYADPSGNPTLVRLSMDELETLF
jgi:DNA mismatch repair protein MutL